MKEREDKTFKRFLIFFVASLLLHFSIGTFVFKKNYYRSDEVKLPPPQKVIFVRPEDILTAPPQQKLELADIAKPKVQKAPKKARFASKYNSSVEKETVARRIPKKAKVDVDVSDEPKRPKAKKIAKKPAPNKVAAKSLGEEISKIVPEEKKLKEPPPQEKIGEASGLTYSDLQLKPSDFKELVKDNVKGTKEPAKEFGNGTPTITALPRNFGASGMGDRFVHDFMPHVKIGDKTYLNTHAFPDVQYFTRLKRIFRLRFNPRAPLVAHFSHNRVVVGSINVTMGMEVAPDGHLRKLFVMKSSGIPGYDHEALRTVRQSAPFSSPPKKICGKDGMLRMTWHFTTYL